MYIIKQKNMQDNTNIHPFFYALYMQRVKQHIDNIQLGFITLKKNLMKLITLTLLSVLISVAAGAQVGPILGPSDVCAGANVTFVDSTTGGTWSCSNPSIATINPATGVLTGVTAGVVTITYTNLTFTTATVTINPLPSSISSVSAVCTGISAAATNSTPGGIWSSSDPGIASVNSFGLVSGVSPGVAEIIYTLPTGCAADLIMTVNATPTSISGTTSICAGSATSLMNSIPGGVWSSSSPGVATVGSASGAVSAMAAGVATIYYSLAGGCSNSVNVTVNILPAAISGTATTCLGNNISLSCPTAGGSWSSSSIGIATVGPSGIVSGVSAGTATISYTLLTGCFSTRPVSINPLPASYAVSSGGAYCAGGTGYPVSLASSQTGVTYQLFRGTTLVSSLAGTGSALNFGLQTSGAYVIKGTSSTTGCINNMGGTANISVNALPAAYNVSGGGVYCAGGSGYPINLSGSQTGVNYLLKRDGTITGISVTGTGGSISFGLQSAAGIYTVQASNLTTGCVNNMNGSASVSINALPNAYTVSAGASTICAGSTGVHVNLSGSSTGIQYQLRRGFTPIGLPLTGTGTPIDFGLFTTAGSYDVIAINPVTGCTSIMSGSPSISVNPLPALDTITGGGGYCSGTPGSHIGLNGSDAGISYQLFNGGIASGSSVTGTGAPVDFGIFTSGTYTAVATNPVTGCARTMAGTKIISVNVLPVAYNVTSSGSSYCSGGSGIPINLSSSNTGISYQLFRGSLAVGSPVSGTGSPLGFGYQSIAGTYTVAATNTMTGCSSNMTGSPSIAILTSPTVFSVTGDGSYCSGGPGIPVGLLGSSVGISYQLLRNDTLVGVTLPGTGGPLDFGYRTPAGKYTIKATNTLNGCTNIMFDSAVISIIPLPAQFTVLGGGSYCTGDTGVHVRLSGSSSGITYQLFNGATPVGGILTGTGAALDFGLQTAAGLYTVKGTSATTGCVTLMAGSALVTINVLPNIYAMVGGGSYCSGSAGVPIGLLGSTAGMSYRLYNGPALAGSLTGSGTVLNFGPQTDSGTYTVIATNPATGCVSNMSGSAVISVIATVSPSVTLSVSPNDTVCTGVTVTYTATSVNGGSAPAYQWLVNGVISGTGSSYSYIPGNADVVTVNMASSAPCATPASVSAGVTMTVRPNPSITGSTSTCVGTSVNLSGTPGGVWTSSNPAIANVAAIGSTIGVLTGMSVGVGNISYSLLGCTSVIVVTVNGAVAISAGSTAAACGGTYTLTANGGVSYSWLPVAGLSCPSCSTTIARPLATTVYTVTGTAANGCSAKAKVTLNGNRISGYISYTGASSDVFKVWLIRFNPADSTLTGVDSTLTCMNSGTPYYEFTGKPASNYCVKAKLLGTVPGTSGYIPTYSLSTPYWYAAANAAHTNATDTLHINMIYGTVPAGPGFIGGTISSGAGKGTIGDVPAEGMIVYLKDASSNNILTYTYTDAAGNYSFSNIAAGNYIIYPEEFLYTTTTSSAIAVGDGTDSAKGVNFRQFITSRQIKPLTVTGIAPVAQLSGNIDIYPNPTSGIINIRWAEQTPTNATLSVTDVVGRTVYTGALNMDKTGETQLDLGSAKAGIYLVNLRAVGMSYTWRIVVEK